MKIGLISDTHIPQRAKKISDKVFEVFNNVDLILHAGDVTSQEVIDELEEIAPVKYVSGNMDRVAGFDGPKNIKIEVDNLKIGLIHGEVYPKGDTLQLKYLAMEMDVDILVTGHTHKVSIEELSDILLLNPGSPTDPRLSDPTVMILEITNGEADVEIVKVGAPTCSALTMGF